MSGEKMFLVCLLIACVASQTQMCPGLVCGSSKTTTGVCISALSATFVSTVTPCSSGYYCSGSYPTNSDQSCVKLPTPPTPGPAPTNYLLAGIKSSKAIDCRSGATSNGYCTGNATGVACGSNYDCAPGLWCNNTVSSGLCQSTVAYGANCSNGAPCKRGSQCISNICVKEYTLADGAVVPSCASHNFNNLCASGTCGTNSTGTSLCIPAITSSAGLPMGCNITGTNQCASAAVSSLIGGGTVNSNCNCGSNPTGAYYCSYFSGDSWPTKARTSTMNWLASSSYDDCNWMVSDLECAQNHWSSSSVIDWVYYTYMSGNQPLMTNAGSCVVTLFYPEYKTIYDAYNSAWAITASIVALNFLV